jgi:cobalt-zinc-cadmium resistance protein CzcA
MFRPMAQTVGFAIFGALILSLTYIPMMCAAFLSKNSSHKETFSDRMMNLFHRIYAPLLEKAIRLQKNNCGCNRCGVSYLCFYLFKNGR